MASKILNKKELFMVGLLVVMGIVLLFETPEATTVTKEETVVATIVSVPNIIDLSQLRISTVVSVDQEVVSAPIIEVVVDTNTYYDIPMSIDDQAVIRQVVDSYGLDYELVLSIIAHESKYNPEAIGDHGNSMGLMQIQPRWWTKLYDKTGCTNWLGVKDNVTVGCEILQYLYTAYGDTTKVLNAYNTGDPNNYNGYANNILDGITQLKESR